MRRIIEKEMQISTEYGHYRLVYCLLESGKKVSYYGVEIWQRKRLADGREELFDYSLVAGFSEDYQEAVHFFALIFQESVMPVHLYDIVDDWKCGM